MSILRGSTGSSLTGGISEVDMATSTTPSDDCEVAPGAPSLLCLYAWTRSRRVGSVNACRLATIRSVTSAIGNVVKSNEARNAVELAAALSTSTLRRLASVGWSATGPVGKGRFLTASAAVAATAALRAFSSADALSIRAACWESASLI